LPPEVELMDLLGYIYLRHGLPDKAAVLLAARDLLYPDDAPTLLRLALAQARAMKPQRALATLDRLALLGAMDAPFHLVRAQALQALGRAEEAAGAMCAHVAMRPAAAGAGASA
jgi:Flp pilus assembly protein TadD